MHPSRYILALFGLAAALLGAGCLFDSQAKGGHVVENELAGILYASGGGPAAYADVKAYPVDHIPNKGLLKGTDTSLIYSFRTDAEGRFEAEGLRPGVYNFLGSKDGALSYQDSVVVTDETDSIPSDTLGAPGSVTVRVALEPNHDPQSVFIQVLGTDHFAVCDSKGFFTLSGFGAGTYALRIATILPEYQPNFPSITVKSGQEDTLANPIRLVFIGIPVVRGLAARYDTAQAVARITWSPSLYPFLKEYRVYRVDPASLTESDEPIAKLRDTVFVDSLKQWAKGPWPDTSKPPRFEYRVSIRNLSGTDGLVFGSGIIEAVPIAAVRTVFTFGYTGKDSSRASIGDSARIFVRWRNPGRDGDSLIWFEQASGAVLRSAEVAGREGVDTLSLRMPAKAGDFAVGIRMVDAIGDSWIRHAAFNVMEDAPVVSAGKDTTVTPGDRIRLGATAAQKFGYIAKWEWDIGRTGSFTATSTGDTLVNAPDQAGIFDCIVRATDDDGNQDLDTVRITVFQDVPQVRFKDVEFVTISDTIRLAATIQDLGMGPLQYAWDMEMDGSFIPASRPDTFLIALSAPGLMRFVLRVSDEDGNAGYDTLITRVIDDKPNVKINFASRSLEQGGGYALKAIALDYGRIAKWEWSLAGGILAPGSGPDTVYLPNPGDGSRLNVTVRLTDEDGNPVQISEEFTVTKWDWRKSLPKGKDSSHFAETVAAEMDGKIYFTGGNAGSAYLKGAYAMDPATGRVDTLPPMLETAQRHGLFAVNGKLYAMGGENHFGQLKTVQEYDPFMKWWTRKKDMSRSAATIAGGVVNGKIYVFRGANVDVYDPSLDQWTTREHDAWINSPPNAFAARVYSASSWASVAALDGKLYVLSTLTDQEKGDFIGMTIYDPGNDTWTVASRMPYEPYQPAMAAAKGKIHVIGAAENSNSSKRVEAYDPVSDSWSEKSPLHFDVFWKGAVSTGGRIHALGVFSTVQVYNPDLEP